MVCDYSGCAQAGRNRAGNNQTTCGPVRRGDGAAVLWVGTWRVGENCSHRRRKHHGIQRCECALQSHGAKQYYYGVLLDGVLFLPDARAAQPQADRLDVSRIGCRRERTFLLRDALVTIHSRSVRGVSGRRTLASRTPLRGAIRVAGARLPLRVRPTAELLHNAPGLVLRTGRGSHDLEPDTRELA